MRSFSSRFLFSIHKVRICKAALVDLSQVRRAEEQQRDPPQDRRG